MRYPVSDAFGLLGARAGLGESLTEQYARETAEFKQKYQPAPSGHGFRPPTPYSADALPSGLSSEQVTQLCRLVEVWAESKAAVDAEGAQEAVDVYRKWTESLSEYDKSLTQQYMLRRCGPKAFQFLDIALNPPPRGIVRYFDKPSQPPITTRPIQTARPFMPTGDPVRSVDVSREGAKPIVTEGYREFPVAPMPAPVATPGGYSGGYRAAERGMQMYPPVATPGGGAAMPTSMVQPSGAMTPTPGGGGAAPCPPGQFRPAPGAPCRGSVGAMPGIPGGLTPSGGGAVPVAAPYLSGGRIARGGFGQSIW